MAKVMVKGEEVEIVPNNDMQEDTTVNVMRLVMCWGWLNRDKTIQATTFCTSSGAIAEMCKRLSLDPTEDFVLDKIYEAGFKLIQVEKRLTISRVLE